MAVLLDIGGHRMLVDARVYTLALDCGCWGHMNRECIAEVAISPTGRLLGVRSRTDQPFTYIASVGPILVRIDANVSLEDNDKRQTNRTTRKQNEHENEPEQQRARQSDRQEPHQADLGLDEPSGHAGRRATKRSK